MFLLSYDNMLGDVLQSRVFIPTAVTLREDASILTPMEVTGKQAFSSLASVANN